MKNYILLDKDNICRCIATEQCNLHSDKIAAGMKTFRIKKPVNIGDEIIPGKEIFYDHVIGYEKVEVEPAVFEKDVEVKPAVLISQPITEKRLDFHECSVIAKPENYPGPTNEELIRARMYKIAKDQLIAEGIING